MPFTMQVVTARWLLPSHISWMKYHDFQLQGLGDSRQEEVSKGMKSINKYHRWKGYRGTRVSLFPDILSFSKTKETVGRERCPYSFRPQVKQAEKEFLEQFLLFFSCLCQHFHLFFSIQTRPSSAVLKGHTHRDRLQRHKATWMLGTSLKHVPRQVPSKPGSWAVSPQDQPCRQLAEYLVRLEPLLSTTISAGHSVFCSHSLIKPLLERNVSATKIKCLKLLLNI